LEATAGGADGTVIADAEVKEVTLIATPSATDEIIFVTFFINVSFFTHREPS